MVYRPLYNATGMWVRPHAMFFGTVVIEGLAVPRFVVAGNSLGGEVAWRTAVLAPARVAALVLVDAAGPPFVPESVPLGFRVARIPVLNRISEFALPRGLVEEGVKNVYGDPGKVTPELVDRYFELTLREGNREALRQRMEHLVSGENAERIAKADPTFMPQAEWAARFDARDLSGKAICKAALATTCWLVGRPAKASRLRGVE